MGVLLSLLSPLPVHVALDNRTVVNRALYFKQLIAGGSTQRVLFSQLVDGDLWLLFYHVLRMRGCRSFTATWTKGHALTHEDYLSVHPLLRYQAYFNDQ
eukprot:9240033-Karenia_brevis.AAC.1